MDSFNAQEKSTISTDNALVTFRVNSHTRPVPKNALTRRYDAVKERVWAGAAKVRTAFFSDSWAGGAMWFAAVLVMIAVLLWFFFFSDFGTPAEPIYEGF